MLGRLLGIVDGAVAKTFTAADDRRARGLVGTVINVPALYWGAAFNRGKNKGKKFPCRVVGFKKVRA